MEKTIPIIQSRLLELQDLQYKAFHSKLMPTVDPDLIIGVRTPALRKLAKELSKTPLAEEFLQILPHHYYEENNLHVSLIENIKDYHQVMAYTEAFLPHIDNWATCDLFSPKVFKKHPGPVLEKIRLWVKSQHPYTVRYGIGLLLSNYLDQEFRPEFLDLVADTRSQEYYVNMMIAWYFSTALTKQYEEALPYLQEQRLDPWTHNKAIQKSMESYRISDERKAYLRKLKRKPLATGGKNPG